MNNGLIIALLACFCVFLSSTAGSLYWFRCDFGLVECKEDSVDSSAPGPSPSPSPSPSPAVDLVFVDPECPVPPGSVINLPYPDPGMCLSKKFNIKTLFTVNDSLISLVDRCWDFCDTTAPLDIEFDVGDGDPNNTRKVHIKTANNCHNMMDIRVRRLTDDRFIELNRTDICNKLHNNQDPKIEKAFGLEFKVKKIR